MKPCDRNHPHNINDPRFIQNPDGTYGPTHCLFPPSKAEINRERMAREVLEVKIRRKVAVAARRERRPVFGSQEWAETRGDDIGASPDY